MVAPLNPTRLGRYEVIGLLATGGMAEVYLGRLMGPSGFERVVVLKRILPHLARETAFVDMFLDEARIVAKINHPNVVQVNELGRDADELFLAMEFIEGESLGGFMRRHWVGHRAIGLELAAFVVSEMCAGLHAAHELKDEEGRLQEIVHRDVSPQNVMITYSGKVKVLDFGIAKAVDRSTRTRTGQLKGKVEYMSPEQCKALPLDRRSDVFALGVLLYELTMGKRLFRRGGELASLKAVTEEPIPTPRSIDPSYPEALEAICMRALARDLDERYASADEMRRAIVGFLRTTPNMGFHEEVLGERMRELFADRLEVKNAMLRKVRAGTSSLQIPAPEVDLSVEHPMVPTVVPTVVYPPSSNGTSVALAAGSMAPPPIEKRGPWRAVAVLAGAMALTVGGYAAFAAYRDDGASKTAATSALAATVVSSGPASAEPSDKAAAKVVIEIATTPPGARLTVGGQDLGETPKKLELDRGTEPVAVELTLDGYETKTETVTPNVDQRLSLSLTVAPRRGGRPFTRPTAPPPTATSSAGPYRKFN
ncbi:MAG: serine/threonine protein kinase [Polyangiaceae bacterium]|nr:serine/threonine protein kinase [Polyangiaceae bacterium]